MSALTYTLVINGSVYGTQSARNALLFAKALIARGHKLVSVFFYQDGIHNASRLVVPANDELDLTAEWQSLAQDYGVRLETCVAASLRRGVLGAEEASQHTRDVDNLAQGFELAGLGSLASAMLTQDRVVQF
ncbi:sulfurtransferase complex subunit TusD [Vibrio mediterranei]|uniref:Sulfurtransferase TusD homolog n=1 Tax=Vibrio barjaei TaxID=1676683 RepID=A0ABW7IJQ5_9VIBR|nr:sulfurtransferase complex subunit TusD [Vibrio barjaei]MCG9789994.1 sulfurtransferase complex subunit TusD [Vibrio mediterranei]OIN27076.1 sulfurtransferase TusD [Vibrio barjaei]